jgi:alpha-beta hydrolase superfamily lysophospholipase
MNSKHNEGTFEGRGKLTLFYQSWQPAQKPVAVIILVHGGGDHSGRHTNVVNYFVQRQYAIYAFDLRGHGHSPGQRGHINTWNEFREDFAAFKKIVRQEQPDLPVIIYGHSLGGVITLDYCLRNPQGLSGLICSSPAIGELGIAAILWQIARILDRIWPSCPLKTGLDISKLSRDPDVEKAAKADPLYHSKATPRFGMQVKKTVEKIHSNARDLSLPLLIVHGTDDEIASIEGSRKFFNNVTYPDKDFREYKGGFHELHNDINKEQVLTDIDQWLAQHLNMNKPKY